MAPGQTIRNVEGAGFRAAASSDDSLFVIGPYEKITSPHGDPGWTIPDIATGEIDLRTRAQYAATSGDPQGFGVFTIPNSASIPSGYEPFNRTTVQGLLGTKVTGGKPEQWLWQLKTKHTDPTGQLSSKPLMPDHRRFLELHIGNTHLRHPLRYSNNAEWNAVRTMHLAQYQHMYDNPDKFPEQARRKVHGSWARRYPGVNPRRFVPQGIPYQPPLRPTTIYADDYNRPDGPAGANWADLVTSFPTEALIVSGQLEITKTVEAVGADIWVDLLSSVDHWSEVVVQKNDWILAPAQLTYVGASVRSPSGQEASTRDGFYYRLYRSSNRYIRDTKYVNGVWSQSTFVVQAWVPGDILRTRVEGTSFQAYWNGGLVLSQTHTDLDGIINGGLQTGTILYRSSTTGASLTCACDDWNTRDIPPDLNVQYNGVDVADGETTPIVFERGHVGGTEPTLTFSLQNHGDTVVSISSIVVSGNFEVVDGVSSIAVDGSEDLVIKMLTTAEGIYDGVVTIASNDPDEDPYTFAIRGTVGWDSLFDEEKCPEAIADKVDFLFISDCSILPAPDPIFDCPDIEIPPEPPIPVTALPLPPDIVVTGTVDATATVITRTTAPCWVYFDESSSSSSSLSSCSVSLPCGEDPEVAVTAALTVTEDPDNEFNLDFDFDFYFTIPPPCDPPAPASPESPAYFSCYNSTAQTVGAGGDILDMDTEDLNSDDDYSTAYWSLDIAGTDEGELTVNKTGKFRVTAKTHVTWDGVPTDGFSRNLAAFFWMERWTGSAWAKVRGSAGEAQLSYDHDADHTFNDEAVANMSCLVSVTSGDKYRLFGLPLLDKDAGGSGTDYLAPGTGTEEDGCYWAWNEIITD